MAEARSDAILWNCEALKKELKSLSKSIVDGEDTSIQETNSCIGVLSSLISLKAGKYVGYGVHWRDVPQQFRCPLSGSIMTDPVLLSSGQTYDRCCIQNWLDEGKRKCPQTQQIITHTVLTLNTLLREMISEWCVEHLVELPVSIEETDDHGNYLREHGNYLQELLEKLSSSSVADNKKAAKELRMLTKRMPLFREMIGESTIAISRVFRAVPWKVRDRDVNFQEDMVAILLNLSVEDSNKELIAENVCAMGLLIDSLNLNAASTELIANAAATLSTLSATVSNRHVIAEKGALEPLINLLQEGHPSTVKDVGQAIWSLCTDFNNRGTAIDKGAIEVILRRMLKGKFIDVELATLAMLSKHEKAAPHLGRRGSILCLLKAIRESDSQQRKENCVAILHDTCSDDTTTIWDAIRQDEEVYATLSGLAETGTTRAKKKANDILRKTSQPSQNA